MKKEKLMSEKKTREWFKRHGFANLKLKPIEYWSKKVQAEEKS